jgi:Kef-type K+ transport system membrane component KefB
MVLGELVAGIIVGPFALGGLPLFNGELLVVLDETL